MKTSEALSKLNMSIARCSATDEEKEIMLKELKSVVLSLIERDANE